jgi:hypothetical protein
MKKLLLTSFVLLLPLLTSSQEKSTIKVSAHAIHKESSPTFKALIAVSGAYSSLPDELLTLDNLKTKLKEAIQKKGIPWSDLKENPNDFGYETIRFDQEGTIYEYVTSDISAMKKFLQIKTLGLQQLSSVCTFTINDSEAQKLSEKALKKAKERALVIANAMGKDLGEIKEVEDLNNRWSEKVENIIYHNQSATEYTYIINVIFTVK